MNKIDESKSTVVDKKCVKICVKNNGDAKCKTKHGIQRRVGDLMKDIHM